MVPITRAPRIRAIRHSKRPTPPAAAWTEAAIAALERHRRAGEVVRGHALDHDRRGLLGGDLGRDLDDAIRRRHGELGVGAGEALRRDAIAGGEPRHAGAHRLDRSRALVPGVTGSFTL